MKEIILICLSLLFLCNMQCIHDSSLKASLIGRTYNEFSELKQLNTYKNFGGGMLQPMDTTYKKNYGITCFVNDGKKILIIDKSERKANEHNPILTILDVFEIETSKDYQWVNSPFNETEINLVGLGSFDENHTCTLFYAWQIIIENREKDIIKIIPIDLKKVEYISGYEYGGIIFKK